MKLYALKTNYIDHTYYYYCQKSDYYFLIWLGCLVIKIFISQIIKNVRVHEKRSKHNNNKKSVIRDIKWYRKLCTSLLKCEEEVYLYMKTIIIINCGWTPNNTQWSTKQHKYVRRNCIVVIIIINLFLYKKNYLWRWRVLYNVPLLTFLSYSLWFKYDVN